MSDRCRNCDGDGWTAELGHACNGDEKRCQVVCPIQVQEICPYCDGTGISPDSDTDFPSGKQEEVK